MWGLCHAILLCSHVLPVHYSGILKKNKQSCSLVLSTFFFFWSKLLHLQLFFLLFFFGGGHTLEFLVASFYFSRFWKEWHGGEGPRFPAEGAQTLLLFWFAINSFSPLLSTAIRLVCSWLMTDEMWSEGPPKSHVNWSWQKILTVPFWTADTVQNGLAGGRLTTGGSSWAAASPRTMRWSPVSSPAQDRTGWPHQPAPCQPGPLRGEGTGGWQHPVAHLPATLPPLPAPRGQAVLLSAPWVPRIQLLPQRSIGKTGLREGPSAAAAPRTHSAETASPSDSTEPPAPGRAQAPPPRCGVWAEPRRCPAAVSNPPRPAEPLRPFHRLSSDGAWLASISQRNGWCRCCYKLIHSSHL